MPKLDDALDDGGKTPFGNVYIIYIWMIFRMMTFGIYIYIIPPITMVNLTNFVMILPALLVHICPGLTYYFPSSSPLS